MTKYDAETVTQQGSCTQARELYIPFSVGMLQDGDMEHALFSSLANEAQWRCHHASGTPIEV
jgi:hypothetical protein